MRKKRKKKRRRRRKKKRRKKKKKKKKKKEVTATAKVKIQFKVHQTTKQVIFFFFKFNNKIFQ